MKRLYKCKNREMRFILEKSIRDACYQPMIFLIYWYNNFLTTNSDKKKKNCFPKYLLGSFGLDWFSAYG